MPVFVTCFTFARNILPSQKPLTSRAAHQQTVSDGYPYHTFFWGKRNSLFTRDTAKFQGIREFLRACSLLNPLFLARIGDSLSACKSLTRERAFVILQRVSKTVNLLLEGARAELEDPISRPERRGFTREAAHLYSDHSQRALSPHQ